MNLRYTLAQLHADPQLRRREFPVVARQTYLAHAGVCPLPARVTGAMVALLEKMTETGQFEYLFREAEEQGRELAARLLDARADEIAYIPSTSAGLGLVAEGLNWRPGDNVVIPMSDFPANIYPWLGLKRLGVEVRQVPRVEGGELRIPDILERIDAQTRLVAVSSIHYATGWPLDVNTLGREVHALGALLCVDAIQSLGVVPTTVQHVDFLAADGHKWLLGPQGAGVLYVRREVQDRLRAVPGWHSTAGHRDFETIDATPAESARRYEPGSLNAVGVTGLYAALQLLAGLGINAVAEHVSGLRERLHRKLAAAGWTVVGPQPEALTGILAFRKDGIDMARLHHDLDQQNVITSLRLDPEGRDVIRVAPHCANTVGDLQLLLNMLPV